MSAAALDIKPVRLDPRHVQPEGTHWNTWTAILPDGIPVERWIEPDFWLRLHTTLKPLDHVQCVNEGRTYFAELIVIDSDAATGVRLEPLYGKELPVAASARNTAARNRSGLSAQYKGPSRRWCVLDAAGKVLREDLPSEGAALAWIADNVKARER